MIHPHRCPVIIIGLLFGLTLPAQNLVNNPGFEDYTTCPTTTDQMDRATGWSSYGNSSDYFNACAPVSAFDGVGVPLNFCGYQMAHGGTGYAGYILYEEGEPGYREFIGAQLSSPLVVGTTYHVVFHVSHTGGPSFRNPCGNQGVLFTTTAYDNANPPPLTIDPHVNNASVVTDTVGWTTITGTFTADSAYTHIVLGNFFHPSLTPWVNAHPVFNDFSYYYIDDVCVSADPADCDPSNSVQASTGSNGAVLYDHAENTLRLTGTVATARSVGLFDPTGRLECQVPSAGHLVRLPVLARGVHVYLILLDNGATLRGKVLVP